MVKHFVCDMEVKTIGFSKQFKFLCKLSANSLNLGLKFKCFHGFFKIPVKMF